ncbi:MAG: hypothetical protein NWS99_07930 [Paracoccaceae bacterium]|nr:hypothetical protein [Paracoccaceae bacterium]
MSNRVVASKDRRGPVAAQLAAAISRGNDPAVSPDIASALAMPDIGILPAAIPEHKHDAAHLVSMAMGLLGHDLALGDLHEQARIHADAGLHSLDGVAQTLRAMGLDAKIATIRDCQGADVPALAELCAGGLGLILAVDGAMIQIYDADAQDHRQEMERTAFAATFTGRVLRIHTAMGDLQTRHIPDSRPRHWFWGEFARYKRQLGEVAAGSLVANILAVAVSLFAMQVYDRVIPYQSEPTLWVLAIGALLAVGLEAGLKIARSV